MYLYLHRYIYRKRIQLLPFAFFFNFHKIFYQSCIMVGSLIIYLILSNVVYLQLLEVDSTGAARLSVSLGVPFNLFLISAKLDLFIIGVPNLDKHLNTI